MLWPSHSVSDSQAVSGSMQDASALKLRGWNLFVVGLCFLLWRIMWWRSSGMVYLFREYPTLSVYWDCLSCKPTSQRLWILFHYAWRWSQHNCKCQTRVGAMILSHCHGSYAIVDHSRLHVTVFGRLLLKDCRQEHPHESAVLHKLRVRKMTAELSRLLRSIPNVTIDPDSYHGQSFISLLNSKDKTRMIKTSFKQANDIVPIHVLISDMFRL